MNFHMPLRVLRVKSLVASEEVHLVLGSNFF